MIDVTITALYSLASDLKESSDASRSDSSKHRRFLPVRNTPEDLSVQTLTQRRPDGPEYAFAQDCPYETLSIEVGIWSEEKRYQVAELQLHVRASDERGIILALKDLYDPDVTIFLDDAPLSEFFSEPLGLGDSAAVFGHRALVIDMHDSRQHLDASKDRVIPQLLFKDFDIEYDLSQTGAELPEDLNAPVDNEIYVWAGQTLIWRANAELRRRFSRELIAVTASAVAAQERTESLLESIRDLRQKHEAPEKALVKIADLQRELEHFVQAPLQTLASSLGRPMARYLQAQVRQMNMDSRVEELADLLAQAQRTAELELKLKERAAAEQAAEAAADVRTIVTIFAVVSVLLNISGMMIAGISIPTISDARFPSLTSTVAVVALMGLGVAALAVLLLVFGRIRATPQQRRIVRIATGGVAALGVSGLVSVVVLGGFGVAPVMLIVSFGLLAVASLLLAWQLRLSGSH
jgi:hypothetical protein